MSFQTGRPALPPPSADLRGLGWLRAWAAHALSSPNPVWVREMKQSARLLRTPFILLAVTLLTTLIISTIGGILASEKNPASVGMVIFHTFFSLAFFVVTLAGPAVAANSIASEREGRTWEAVQLTGLPPGVVARGKFLAAYTNIGLYIVMMAPVGAMPFLFGGITATETLAAFVWLFLIAGLSVAFGLAISSKMESLRGAILVTLFVALMVVPNLYMALGVGGSFIAHDLWPLVQGGPPVWLPSAYARAPFSWMYLGVLVLLPAAAVLIPAWFLYEVTLANLTSITDDRSTGLRRWFLVSAAAIAAGGAIAIGSVPPPVPPSGTSTIMGMALICLCLYFFFLSLCAFVFAGEPVGPSRRVKRRWAEARAGAFRRALGPGVMAAAKALLAAGVVGVGALLGTAMARMGRAASATDLLSVLILAIYGLCFLVFLVGFGAWVRIRAGTAAMARVVMLVVLFLASAGPWVVAALAGNLTRGASGHDMLIASPSPFYPVVIVDELRRSSAPEAMVVASALSACAWALLGLGLLGSASLRASRIIRDHEKALADSDAFLLAEDQAAQAESKPEAAGPAEGESGAVP